MSSLPRSRDLAAIAAAALMSLPAAVAAGRAQAAQPANAAPDVGQTAPDFSAPGATRYGLLRSPVSLAEFRGKTVVLAFFFKARTKG